MRPYMPAPEYQIDGSAFGPLNCVAATGTVITERASVGRFRIPARRIRAASGDTSGGMEYSTLARTISALTGGDVKLAVRWLDGRPKFRDLIASGVAAGVIIHCSITRWTSRRTGTFTGLHSVSVNKYRWAAIGTCKCEKQVSGAHAEMLVEDPGTRVGWQWWSMELLSRAAEVAGGGGIWVIATRDTEGTSRVARTSANVRSGPGDSYAKRGALVKGRSYTVLSTRDGKPWPRGDGTYATGWHRLQWSASAYVRGKALR